MLELKNTINTMVDQLSLVRRRGDARRREVGTEGVLGGQAQVRGVSGVWRELTENVNVDGQQPDQPGAEHRRGVDRHRRGRPVAQDHRRRRGEILALKNTINATVDKLNHFAAEVTRVARWSAPRARSACRPT